MYPSSGLGGIEGLAFDIAASSIGRHIAVDEWWLVNRGMGVKLPYSTSAGPGECLVFRAKVTVPESRHRWFLKLLLDGNALVKIDGAGWGYDEAHTYFPISPGEHVVEVHATPRTLFGQHTWSLSFRYAYLVEIDWDAMRLGLRLLSIVDFVGRLPRDNPLRRDLEDLLTNVTRGLRVSPTVRQTTLALMILYDMPTTRSPWFSRVDLRRPRGDWAMNAYPYGLGILKGTLEDTPGTAVDEARLREVESRLMEGLGALASKYPKEGVLVAVGHSHIDAAWLWPREETMRKVVRTFSTIVGLMEEYDYTYIQSSAQYYEWVENLDPGLFTRIRELVKAGRWIIAGGMWVEGDVNMADGESLARQFLYGQRYFLSRFGRIARIGWLPDNFGFSANLPQILRKSGIEVFASWRITQAESLTEYESAGGFPLHAFTWVGIDETEIPTHVIPTGYNNMHTPTHAQEAWSMYRSKTDLPQVLYPFGYGDGGGGPTREMLEYRDVINKMPSIPKIINLREDDYIKSLKETKDRLPRWRGELHVEAFRGTYTTNLMIKELMAKAEAQLVDTELWLTVAHAIGAGDYGLGELAQLWKTLLFNQFHDILPGSAIREVYEESYSELGQLLAKSGELMGKAMEGIARRLGAKGPLVIFNPLPWARNGVVEIPPNLNVTAECQDDGGRRFIYVEVPAMGFRAYEMGQCKTPGGGVLVRQEGGGFILENEHVRVLIDDNGDVKSLSAKSDGFEVLKGPMRLVAHVEKPMVSDAWRFSLDSLNSGQELNTMEGPRLTLKGPLIACVESTKAYGGSRVRQEVCLRKGSPVVEVNYSFDWVDKGVLVKAWLDTTINSKEALFDIPFGVVARSTDINEQLKSGKLEVPALRWVDLSDSGRGLAVVAPSRHGYSVSGGRIGLSLLRSPTYPNPWSDVGKLNTTIYLYPHGGSYEDSEVPRITYEVMHELRYMVLADAQGSLDKWSIMLINPPRAILTALKPSEDSKDEIVLRLYNPYRASTSISVTVNGLSISRAVETNIIETEEYGKIDLGNVALRPFEIKTIKVKYHI